MLVHTLFRGLIKTQIALVLILTFNAYAKKSNPDITVNGLFLGRSGNQGSQKASAAANGFHLQEVEFRYSSNIDPFFRGDVTLAAHPAHGSNHGFNVAPEEAYVQTLSLPTVSLKIGKFFAALDRHNHLHTHYYPFIDAPLPNQKILGNEGLNEVGVSASYMFPVPWYSELVLQGFNGQNKRLFATETKGDLVGVYKWKNLWPLTSALTTELNLGYGHGRQSNDTLNHLYSTALTFKWRPSRHGKYQSFEWTTQFLQAEHVNAKAYSGKRVGGISSWMRYQFHRSWWAQLRGEYLGIPDLSQGPTRKYSALLGYFRSHYSGLRLQYDAINREAQSQIEHRATLQLNVSMGTHPTHSY